MLHKLLSSLTHTFLVISDNSYIAEDTESSGYIVVEDSVGLILTTLT